MHPNVEACVKCRRKCLLLHTKRKNSKPAVSSFFKVMFGDEFSTILFIPPKFAPTVSSLIDQEIFLEDSNGLRWRVELTTLEGSFALHQGWDEFASSHGLQIGDFVIFHYIMGSHFVVQIYDRTGCEKLDFTKDRTSRERAKKSDRSSTSEVGPCYTTDDDSIGKRGSNSSVEMTDAGNKIRKSQAVNEQEFEEVPCYNMINREPGGKYDLLTKHLGTVKGSSKIVEGGRSFHHVDTSLLTSKKEAGFGCKGSLAEVPVVASTSSLLPKKRAQLRKKLEIIDVVQDDQPKEQEIIEVEQDDPIGKLEIIQLNHPVGCHDKVDDVISLPGAPIISCLISANDQHFLKLPMAMPFFSYDKRKRFEKKRRLMLLRDPETRLWPVLYQEKSQLNLLISGWEAFSKANNIQPGDECTFEMECLDEDIFRVSIIRKQDRLA